MPERREVETTQTSTSWKSGAAPPLVHDHTPHHGGVVGMSGPHHVEAVAERSGRLHVYVSDLRRNPLPPEGIEAFAVVDEGDTTRRVRLVASGGALAATVDPPSGPFVNVRIEGRLAGEALLIDFTLPVPPAPADATSRLGRP